MKALRFSLGAFFGLVAILGIGHPQALEAAIARDRLLPSAWVGVAAVFLPWLELVPATALLLGFWLEAGALILGSISLASAVALSMALWRHQPTSFFPLGLTIVLVALAAILFRKAAKHEV